jgi:hypothetical protein
MNKLARSVLTLVAVGGIALTAATPAFASGGTGGGGGGGTATGGGGGGSTTKGGVKDVPPVVVAAPCATLPSVTAPVGYYSTWAAVWNTVTVKSCSASTETVNVEVTETNVATGLVDYDIVIPMSLASNQNLSMVLDNDFAPFNTTYTVTAKVSDSSANVLATQSLIATTPPPQ